MSTNTNGDTKPNKRFDIYQIIDHILHVLFYDIVVWLCYSITHTFFRDIKVRSSFNIPKSGPIIFVIGPHHNQFLDGGIAISSVKQYSNRKISFLIAGKSYRRRFIGLLARLTRATPVERSQDLLKSATGKIFLDTSDDSNTVIIGEETKFTQECEIKGLIGLPNSMGNFPIASIESDTKLVVKKSVFGDDDDINEKRKLLLTEGTKYKLAPHIDNNQLFQHVFLYLNQGHVLGLFPEGGSHDRTDLLPLKPGVAIMALGAAAQASDPNQVINIIPVGLSYFHPHKFRSRAVIEFGKPIKITKSQGEEYLKDSRPAVDNLLNTVNLGLREVSVTCDDFETLITLQAARRLYTSGQRDKIPLSMVVEMNRRLIKGYEMHKNDPDVIEMKKLVLEYNEKLMLLGLHDHQVDSISESYRVGTFFHFVERLFKVFLFFGLSLPGIFMFSPVFITAKKILRVKQKEALENSVVKIKARDVIGTWKVLVALILAPALYIFYSILGTILIVKSRLLPPNFSRVLIFLYCYFWSVLTTYASLRTGEIGVDYYKSLKPLFYSMINHDRAFQQINDLKQSRKILAEKVTDFCNRLGPNIFEDYEEFLQNYNLGKDNQEQEQQQQQQQEDTSRTTSGTFNIDNLADVQIFSNEDPEMYQTSSTKDEKETNELGLKIHNAMRNRIKVD